MRCPSYSICYCVENNGSEIIHNHIPGRQPIIQSAGQMSQSARELSPNDLAPVEATG